MGLLPRLLRSGLRRGQHGRRAVHAAAALIALAALPATAVRAAAAGPLPPAVQAASPSLQPAGRGALTFLGLRVYEARLWVAPDFRQARFAEHPLALELHYQRDLRAADIAARSVQEMRRGGAMADEEANRWRAQLQQALPDVRAGDRIVGLHAPGQGLAFLVNGRGSGSIADPKLAARFFGIWLAPSTSEPALRTALLEGTAP
ncbi:hypothetical protein HK414_27375 [Ramlibacter terrae]|uniref:Chalcone isomerase domain-containing protein n=1 Tax=Ramlibacter terrae TaxID=2732511 RepID=A0ABX6PAI3_9BURK|nr:hypothetical protein HK414_27375 [Ramlibacter terrae]